MITILRRGGILPAAVFLTHLVVAAQPAGPPQRIVSTAPSITETLFAMGLGNRVVGVSTFCHYPEQVNRLPRVGTYLKPNTEVIARLRPDLVLLEKLPESSLRNLRKLGLNVVEVDTGDVALNLQTMRDIGRAAGAPQAANELVNRIRQELDGMKKQAANAAPVSVVFVVGREVGRLDGLSVAGGGSYLSELLAVAGGQNIFSDTRQAYLRTSLEVILRRNPSVIIDMGDMSETTGVTEKHKREVVDLWNAQPNIAAVKDKRVFAVAADIFVVPGPRMLDAARAFRHLLHPELDSASNHESKLEFAH